MGIVQRNSIYVTVISYIGVAIGYINKILLFTNFLKPEEVGLANILISIAALYAQFSALGMPAVTLRFFPYFKDKANHNHGLLFWTCFISLLGFLLITLLFILFKPAIVNYYSDNSPLLVEYAFYIIPLGLATVFYNLFEIYLRSLMKIRVPTMVNEIALRFLVTVSIALYAMKIVSFHEFVIIYVGVNCSAAGILIVYTAFLKQLDLKPQWDHVTKRFFRIVVNFGLFGILGNMSYILMNNIDALMVASMAGLKETGIYTTVFFITSVMLIPYRSMARVTSPLIAQFWKSREMNKMQDLYKKTTLMNMLAGCFMFLLLLGNIDNIFYFIPKEYSSGKYVFLFLGMGRLFDMITGMNGVILSNSKKYRYDLLFTILLIMFMILLNLILIPKYGITGASFATMVAAIILNMLRVIYIRNIFKLQPFDIKSIWIMGISALTFLGIYFIPFIMNVYVDLFIRSFVCLVLFSVPVLWLKLSDEVNETAGRILKMAGIKINLFRKSR